MKISNWIKIPAIIIIIMILGELAYQYFFVRGNKLELPTYIEANHTIRVVVIDMGVVGKMDYNSIINGDDAILVVRNDTTTGSKYELVTGQATLLAAAAVKSPDDHITLDDPIFSRLALLFIDKVNNYKPTYITLEKAGIRALFLDKRYNAATNGIKLSHPTGAVLMADGSTRPMADIDIYQPLPPH